MKRLIELFEDDKGRLSLSRLLTLLAFFPASYVVIIDADSIDAPELLAVYLSAYVLGYLGGKGLDKLRNKTKEDDNVSNS